jgi:hypothetical protein
MTIITGVKSPWILGKADRKEKVAAKARYEQELGIEII